jgi:putative ABC transport system permease protein
MGGGKLVLRWLAEKKVRSLLLLLAIAMAFLLYFVLFSIKALLLAPADDAGTRLVVSSAAGFSQPLPLSHGERIAGVAGVRSVAPRSGFGASFRGSRRPIIVIASDPAAYLAINRGLVLSAEAKARFAARPDTLLVGKGVAAQFGIEAGDRITLRSERMVQGGGLQRDWTFDVAGLFEGDATTGSGFALMHYRYYNEGQPGRRDLVGNFLVETEGRSENDRVVQAVDRLFGNSAYETATVTESAYNKALFSQLGDISRIVLAVVAAAFLALLMMVGNNMAIAVRERFRDIGILRTIGFSSRRIAVLILAETLTLSFAGGLTGLLIASSIVEAARAAPGGAFGTLALDGATVGAGFVVMILLGLITGVAPMLIALKVPIVAALARR